jgi:hypothetical protein
VSPAVGAPDPIRESGDLGIMLWDIDYAGQTNRPIFFRAQLRSGVLEVPVSVGCTRRLPELLFRRFRMLRPERLPARVLGKLLGLRKRPVYPLPDMPLREIDAAIRWLIGRGVGYLNLMFHSSELIRNSLCGRTDSEVERFWRRITEIIDIAEDCQCQPGMTLGEFAQLIWAARGAGQNANDASSTGDH